MFKDSFVRFEGGFGLKALIFPLSVATHAVLVLMLVVLPLLKSGNPPRVEVYSAFLAPPAPPPPPPPPPAKKRSSSQAKPASSPSRPNPCPRPENSSRPSRSPTPSLKKR